MEDSAKLARAGGSPWPGMRPPTSRSLAAALGAQHVYRVRVGLGLQGHGQRAVEAEQGHVRAQLHGVLEEKHEAKADLVEPASGHGNREPEAAKATVEARAEMIDFVA